MTVPFDYLFGMNAIASIKTGTGIRNEKPAKKEQVL
jgi:hypothetical protein